MNLRVVKTWGPLGESFLYHFEDVVPNHEQSGIYPFCQHEGRGIFEAESVAELGRLLDLAKAALRKPVLRMTDPKLVEVKEKKRA